MNVPTISMDPRIARIHYADYLKKVREHRRVRAQEAAARARQLEGEARRTRLTLSQQEKEDRELLSAYRTLSTGQRIINMHKVIWGAGINRDNTPKLAIARADWQKCHFMPDDHGRNASFQKDRWLPANSVQLYKLPVANAPAVYSGNYEQRKMRGFTSLEAVVPAIPAHLRPAGDLNDYWILWEAVWTKQAPEDPLLLKQLNDSDKFFVILAQWDLTPIEQQVLEGRFS